MNILDAKEATPLHFAVLQGQVKNVELLIKLGADVSKQDL